MPARALINNRIPDLPSLYSLVSLREAGDAFAHACAVASESGAGTLVTVDRYDLAEFAVVLEPEETFREARHAHYIGMNAIADALSAHAPPERPVAFGWPDAIQVDGVLVGGGRLGWPKGTPEEEAPPWLVFSGMIRTSAIRAGEPGLRPSFGALDEIGFDGLDPDEIIAGFARHLMAGLHEWSEIGFTAAVRSWLDRLTCAHGKYLSLADNGDLLISPGRGLQPTERRSLAESLVTPSWLDPTTGTPWL